LTACDLFIHSLLCFPHCDPFHLRAHSLSTMASGASGRTPTSRCVGEDGVFLGATAFGLPFSYSCHPRSGPAPCPPAARPHRCPPRRPRLHVLPRGVAQALPPLSLLGPRIRMEGVQPPSSCPPPIPVLTTLLPRPCPQAWSNVICTRSAAGDLSDALLGQVRTGSGPPNTMTTASCMHTRPFWS
jgi:hypothetical protein